jgi:tetratricopeptide (TPR) repeat protein
MSMNAGGTLLFAAALVAGGLVLPHRVSKSAQHADTKAPLAAEMTGCGLVRNGPICEVGGERVLKFFVATNDPVQATTDRDTPTIQSSELVPGGRRLKVQVPEAARELVLSTSAARFRLTLAPHQEAAVLKEARALRQKGEADKAEKVLKAALPSLSPEEQGRARALIGRIQLARGEVESGLSLLAQSTAEADRAGRLSDAIDDRLARAYANTIYTRNFADARAILAESSNLAEANPAEQPRILYYEGLLATETGDLRGALSHYYDAAARAERLDLQPSGRHARQQIALTLTLLGRTDEALQVQQALIASDSQDTPCNLLDLRNNLVWISSVARASGRSSPSVDASVRQLTQPSSGGCSDPTRMAVALLTTAEWAVASGDTRAAEKLLHRLGEDAKTAAQIPLPRLLLEGRVALLDKRAKEALAKFERLEKLARSQAAFTVSWSAQAYKGAAFHMLGRTQDAIRAWTEAERELDTLVLRVPLGEGRSSFVGDRDESVRWLASTLVAIGNVSQAFDVARHARARTLRSFVDATRFGRLSTKDQQIWDSVVGRYLRARAESEKEAKEDWKLPGDALNARQAARADRERSIRRILDEALALFRIQRDSDSNDRTPPSGEVTLLYFPGIDGLIGFAQTATSLTAKKLVNDPTASPEQLGRELLSPFRTEIEASQKVRVVAYGALRQVDFHALPYENAPLLESVAVEYAVDAGIPVTPRRASKTLVVSDPTADLPQSGAEGRLVAQLLPQSNHLSGSQAARSAVLMELTTADWFHYAGHAAFSDKDGLDAALKLADGNLTASDVLASSRVPGLVVLSACETGRSTEAAPEGIGLAQAFVLRGASAVVASPRPMRDKDATLVAKALYPRLRSGENPSAALRHAVLAARTNSPSSDWSALRTIVP